MTVVEYKTTGSIFFLMLIFNNCIKGRKRRVSFTMQMLRNKHLHIFIDFLILQAIFLVKKRSYLSSF